MKMKKEIFFRVKLLCLFLLLLGNLKAQNYITLPINGSVFQRGASGNTTVYFTFYDKESYSDSKIFYRIIKMGQPDVTIQALTPLTKTFPNANNLKGLFASFTLQKGWYRVEFVHKWKFLGIKDCIDVLDKSEFGVGDVYFAAGQSNASGFNEIDNDNVVPYSTDDNSNQQDDKGFER